MWFRRRGGANGELNGGSPGPPAPRAKPDAQAPVQVQIMGDHSLDIVFARDISETGVGIFVPHSFEGCGIDGEVDLLIALPGVRPFLAKGRVRHLSKTKDGRDHFGVRFVEIADAHRDAISDYIDDMCGRAD